MVQRIRPASDASGSDKPLPEDNRSDGSRRRGYTDRKFAILGHHLLDFWINICLCHSLIVEDRDEEPGPPGYQVCRH